jgi:hypothetical protein
LTISGQNAALRLLSFATYCISLSGAQDSKAARRNYTRQWQKNVLVSLWKAPAFLLAAIRLGNGGEMCWCNGGALNFSAKKMFFYIGMA